MKSILEGMCKKTFLREESMGENNVGEEEYLGKKSIWVQSMCKKSFWVKNI